LYQVSCIEADFLVALAREAGYVAGARMMGGGFGGCVLVLVSEVNQMKLIEICKELYYQKFDRPLIDYSVKIEKGTEVL
jgi:galactokinase